MSVFCLCGTRRRASSPWFEWVHLYKLCVLFRADSESCDEGDLVFEALIILEEFCKELAAIAFVKYHHATE